MFKFLKNLLGGSETPATKVQESTPINEEALLETYNSLRVKLDTVEGEAKADVLDALGEVCLKLDKADEAIECYESSLAIRPALGASPANLLKLYNQKRRAAATANDDTAISLYMDKIDNLMKMNKETMKKNSTC